MHKFLLRFNSIEDADTVLAASNYARFEDRNEEQVSIDVPVPMTIANQSVGVTENFSFLASQIKALTLPSTITRARNVKVNGGENVSTSFEYVVDNLRTFKRERENWISFTVNGERYAVPDDGGKVLAPEAGVTLYDFNANGWPLVNIRAVYDQDGNQTTAPSVIPGVFVVMQFFGERYEDDLVANSAGDTLWETSKLARNFKNNGTERTYTRNSPQTDWGEGYALTYYEQTIGGAVVGMVDPADLPEQIRSQHGVLR
jgi:hypothetical protein